MKKAFPLFPSLLVLIVALPAIAVTIKLIPTTASTTLANRASTVHPVTPAETPAQGSAYPAVPEGVVDPILSEADYPPPPISANSTTNPAAEPTVHPTACPDQWKTFANDPFGMSFSYPGYSDIKFSDDGGGPRSVYIPLHLECSGTHACNGQSINVQIYPNPENLSAKDYYASHYSGVTTYHEVLIDGVRAWRLDDTPSSHKSIVIFTNNGYVFSFYIQMPGEALPSPAPCAETVAVMDQILKSVKLSGEN